MYPVHVIEYKLQIHMNQCTYHCNKLILL